MKRIIRKRRIVLIRIRILLLYRRRRRRRRRHGHYRIGIPNYIPIYPIGC